MAYTIKITKQLCTLKPIVTWWNVRTSCNNKGGKMYAMLCKEIYFTYIICRGMEFWHNRQCIDQNPRQVLHPTLGACSYMMGTLPCTHFKQCPLLLWTQWQWYAIYNIENIVTKENDKMRYSGKDKGWETQERWSGMGITWHLRIGRNYMGRTKSAKLCQEIHQMWR